MKDVSEVSMPETLEKNVTLTQAVKILEKWGIRLSYGQLLRLVKSGKLPSHQHGIRNLVSISTLIDYYNDPLSPLWTKKSPSPQ